MEYKDLFLLEHYLKSEELSYSHLDFAEEMELKYAIEQPKNEMLEGIIIRGMVIVIFCNSKAERTVRTKEIFKIGMLAYNSRIISYTSKENQELIVIDANETK